MIPCMLVHHTGTMIRFRPSQLDDLPYASQDLHLVLPSGRIVEAHFQRNPANPNISGAGVVHYIKRRLDFKENEPALLQMKSANLWQIHLLSGAVSIAKEAGVPVSKIKGGTLASADLAKLLQLADKENAAGVRRSAYERILRPSGLRRLVINLVGTKCMVQECEIVEEFDNIWGGNVGESIVEIHHIEEVARMIDHHPRNLCVLCANHHRFVHAVRVHDIQHVGANVVMQTHVGELLVERPPAFFA